METRAIIDEHDNVLATISFPEGTPEEMWEQSFLFHAPHTFESEEVPVKKAWWKFW